MCARRFLVAHRFNLVIGVGAGVFLAACRFSFSASTASQVTALAYEKGEAKKYVLHGALFFGNAMRFHTHFDFDNDPEEVVLVLP